MQNEEIEIPKYVVLEKSLIGNEIHEAGAVVAYDGLPAENLQPTCDVGRARYQEYLRSNTERVARMKDQFTESAVGDPTAFAAAVAKANAEVLASIPGMVATAVAQAIASMQPAAAPAAAEVPAAPAAGDTPAATTKPAGKAKADKPAGDGDSLV